MTRRCSPDIIEEASPPRAAVAALPPRWSLTRCGAQRSTCRGAGPAVQRGFTAHTSCHCGRLGAHSPSPLRDPGTGRSERPGDAHRARLPSSQLLLAAGALHASPPARAPSPALGRRTHGPRARTFPALPRQTHGRERARAPRNIPGSSARASAGPGAQE